LQQLNFDPPIGSPIRLLSKVRGVTADRRRNFFLTISLYILTKGSRSPFSITREHLITHQLISHQQSQRNRTTSVAATNQIKSHPENEERRHWNLWSGDLVQSSRTADVKEQIHDTENYNLLSLYHPRDLSIEPSPNLAGRQINVHSIPGNVEVLRLLISSVKARRILCVI
jgi:hypothetical protein